jgi:hypothetical protein
MAKRRPALPQNGVAVPRRLREFCAKRDGLGKLFDMAKRACIVPARRCSQPFDKNAGAVRRPRHFDSNNSNFQRRPQRWVYQCRLAPTVQKPPLSGLLSQQDIHPTKDTGIRATFSCLVAYASMSSI